MPAHKKYFTEEDRIAARKETFKRFNNKPETRLKMQVYGQTPEAISKRRAKKDYLLPERKTKRNMYLKDYFRLHPELKDTYQNRTKIWRQQPHNKIKELNTRLKSQYGITLADKVLMYVAQEGECPICKMPFMNLSSAYVDHCHRTGRIRGLLHGYCNTFVGYLESNPLFTCRGLQYTGLSNDSFGAC